MTSNDDDFVQKMLEHDALLDPIRKLIRDAYGHTHAFHSDVLACPICEKAGRKSVLTWELHHNGHIHFFCADDNCVRSME